MVEVKSAHEAVMAPRVREQAARYWTRYRLVLVTNLREFVLVGEDAAGRETPLESFHLAENEVEFARRLDMPCAFARKVGTGLGEYLCRALSHRAALAEPKDLAWLLASHARDGLARVEAAGDTPSLQAVRSALEEALGVRFEGDKGLRFFHSTLVQTLFYGVFSAWVLWARADAESGGESPFAGGDGTSKFDWRTAVWHLRALSAAGIVSSSSRTLAACNLSDWSRCSTGRRRRSIGWTVRRSSRASTRARWCPTSTSRSSKRSIPALRKQLGVWYTPVEVVRYMVARVDRGVEGRPRHPGRAGGRECLRARPVLRHRCLSRRSAAPHCRQSRRGAVLERSLAHG